MTYSPNLSETSIGIIGLGYVGLPLACMFARRYPVIGYDINAVRVDRINNGIDSNHDLSDGVLSDALAAGLRCTTGISELRRCNVYIVTVPTPVDTINRPDLSPLIGASHTVGTVIKPGDTVIYESTVYPGATEEVCLPVIEKTSGLKLNSDFCAGYSPERINPGDYTRPVNKITKITSGSTPEAARFVDDLYASVLDAGTCRATSIKVAEAAKVLENTQRDVNIALMNEMAKVCDAIGIDTGDVLDAAGTKWNFMHVRPGLVGGHCIGIDPYYLIHKAKTCGIDPMLISMARSVNDGLPAYVAGHAEALLRERGIAVDQAMILLLGFTFKENCRDTRNTRVVDIYHTLRDAGADVEIFDPLADPEAAKAAYGIDILTTDTPQPRRYDLVIYCVNHDRFRHFDIRALLRGNGAIFDLTGGLPRAIPDKRL